MMQGLGSSGDPLVDLASNPILILMLPAMMIAGPAWILALWTSGLWLRWCVSRLAGTSYTIKWKGLPAALVGAVYGSIGVWIVALMLSHWLGGTCLSPDEHAGDLLCPDRSLVATFFRTVVIGPVWLCFMLSLSLYWLLEWSIFAMVWSVSEIVVLAAMHWFLSFGVGMAALLLAFVRWFSTTRHR